MTNYIKAPVLVPADRVDDFYEYFAAWLRNEPMVPAQAPTLAKDVDLEHWMGPDPDGPDEEVDAARQIWSKLSPRAQAMFRVLAGEPGRRFTAEELVALVDIPNGIYGVAGVLAWPARHAQAAGYHLPVHFEAGEAGQGASYWMSSEAAESFRKVMDT